MERPENIVKSQDVNLDDSTADEGLKEYCNDCEVLVYAEEDSSNFYCDCGNEWVEGEQERPESDDDFAD